MTQDEISKEVDQWFSLAELRSGPSGKRVLIANARKSKPDKSAEKDSLDCIFCPNPDGSYNLSLPFLSQDLIEEMNNRKLYVIENKFPTVSPPETSGKPSAESLGIYYERMVAKGRHLVMIEPTHDLNPFSDSGELAQYYQDLTWGYIAMLKTLKAEGFPWAGIGKNWNGSMGYAGSSQPHTHSQAIGTTIRPSWLEEILQGSFHSNLIIDGSGIKMRPGCGECFESRNNRYSPQIVISQDDIHVSFVSPTPDDKPYHYEISIIPYAHAQFFDEMSEKEFLSFGNILHKTMIALGGMLPGCGYNYELRQGPWKLSEHSQLNSMKDGRFHWKFNIYPASAAIETLKSQGFMSHLLGIPILSEAPEAITYKLRQK